MSQGQVEIYLRSSALGGVGIHWRNISKAEQPNEEPSVLKQRVIVRDDGKLVTISSLINDTKPSLILARYENKILLEVTGLEAAEARSKSMGRRISEIVLWVGDASPEVECQLRQLAAYALLGFWEKESKFIATISNSINFEGVDSFKADAEQIEQLYTNAAPNLAEILSALPSTDIDNCESVWLKPTIINNNNELHILVRQISQTSLPETEQPVVVVAEFKKDGDKQEIVYKGNVWKKKPEPEPKPEPQLQPKLESQSKAKPNLQPEPPLKSRLGAGIFLVLIILLAILIIVLTPTPALTPAPTEILKQISPSKTTNPQNLPQSNNSLISPGNQLQSSPAR